MTDSSIQHKHYYFYGSQEGLDTKADRLTK